ncbi:hypothetical protein HLB44_24385 [Aquincola sp. S2]|uniref:DUF1127 domain-containing protein n=1 Tax=Pseudaquabacterium terrae TaxID=2732868 RepID=A0ABX2ENT8_9BURK|nr:hypothetical protein [Aquabacterium terrae]NRF70149.1 hypothetical protein [Aquabacterium terrae]
MNANTCTMPVTIPLHRPLWQRWTEAAREHFSRLRTTRAASAEEMDLQAAIELNDATLRDIGAPEWLQAEAAARREVDSLALRAARADLAGGGVRWYG